MEGGNECRELGCDDVLGAVCREGPGVVCKKYWKVVLGSKTYDLFKSMYTGNMCRIRMEIKQQISYHRSAV